MRRVIAIFLSTSLALTLQWSQFWEQPLLFLLWLLGFVFLFSPLTSELDSDLELPKPGKLRKVAMAWGLIPILPICITHLLSFGREFPFSGDYDHHAMVFERLLLMAPWIWAVNFIGLAVSLFLVLRKKPTWLLLVPLAVMHLAASHFDHPVMDIARYPTGLYVLSAPLSMIFGFFSTFTAYQVLQISNALSVVIFLFVLRPFFLGRWPDARGCLIALLLTLQNDNLYFLTSNYLEPWSMMILVLSLELFFFGGSRFKSTAVLLAGLAAMFKEQAIFFAGALWLAWFFTSPGLRLRSRVTLGFLTLLPFLGYFLIRSRNDVWRTTEALPWDAVFSHERISELLYRTGLHTGLTGWVLPVSGAILLFIALRKGRRSDLLSWVPVLLTTLALEVLYFVDKISQEYTGYPRWHIFTWAVFAVFFVYLIELFRPQKKIWSLAFVVALISHLPVTLGDWKKLTINQSGMNFREHYDMPLYLPIRQLVQNLKSLPRPVRLVINDPIGDYRIQTGLVAGYADLLKGEDLVVFVEENSFNKPVCRCKDGEYAVLHSQILRDIGLAARRPVKVDRVQLDAGCFSEIRKTCRTVTEVHDGQGRLWGMLGY